MKTYTPLITTWWHVHWEIGNILVSLMAMVALASLLWEHRLVKLQYGGVI